MRAPQRCPVGSRIGLEQIVPTWPPTAGTMMNLGFTPVSSPTNCCLGDVERRGADGLHRVHALGLTDDHGQIGHGTILAHASTMPFAIHALV